jgi:hypothetical protein
MNTWVIVGPSGLYYVGLHANESSAWSIALGWPSSEEVESRKKSGWYAAKAEITWRRP